MTAKIQKSGKRKDSSKTKPPKRFKRFNFYEDPEQQEDENEQWTRDDGLND